MAEALITSSYETYKLDYTGAEVDKALSMATKTGDGDPSTATKGEVGQLYYNTADGSMWKCSGASEGLYTWTLVDTQEVPGVFIAEYGVTTCAEIEEAYTAGKVVFCRGEYGDAMLTYRDSEIPYYSFTIEAAATPLSSDGTQEYVRAYACILDNWGSETFEGANKKYVDEVAATLIPASEKGVAGGVATLGDDGKVPTSQLPDDLGSGSTGGTTDTSDIISNVYCICETAASEVNKEATVVSGRFELKDGAVVHVFFDAKAPTSSPTEDSYVTLNVDGTGAYDVYAGNDYIPARYWSRRDTLTFVFNTDYEAWVVTKGYPADTANYGVTKLNNTFSSNSGVTEALSQIGAYRLYSAVVPKAGTTMTGALIAASDSTPTTEKMRNESLNAAETTPTAEGSIAWLYE